MLSERIILSGSPDWGNVVYSLPELLSEGDQIELSMRESTVRPGVLVAVMPITRCRLGLARMVA